MKLENLPDFAKPYKKKGYDVRKKGDKYQLFRISSQRINGKSYPVLKQEYIGTIQPDGHLKRKSTTNTGNITYQEFGLSDFLYKRYFRNLQKSLFNTTAEFARHIILLAVLYYVFGSVSDTAISLCRLTSAELPELRVVRETKQKTVDRLSKKIREEQNLFLCEDKEEFELVMKMCVVDSISIDNPSYPPRAVEILAKHGDEE